MPFRFWNKILIITLLITFNTFPLSALAAEIGGDSPVDELAQEISKLNREIQELNEKTEEYQREINNIQKQKVNLKNQISLFTNRIKNTEAEMRVTEIKIKKTDLEIEQTKIKIQNKEIQIEEQKEKMAGFIRLIHKLDQKSYLEILLLNDSLSVFFNQIRYSRSIQEDLQKTLEQIKITKERLEQEKESLEEKRKELEILKKDLTQKNISFNYQKDAKMILLEETQNSEFRFKQLLNELKQEQEEINQEIIRLEKIIREKLKREGRIVELGSGIFIWPIPNNGITATFHDASYPFRYIFEHPAIDIRAAQGTPIAAADSGYVGRVRNGGARGYSYIMLIHKDGLSTVYGHVSRIDIEEGDYVIQGQTIALSGGMPGTPGAGRLTTGPHLHFEVRQNGIPVDPLNYLP